MKRADNLMCKIASMDNLIKADAMARLGKKHRKGIEWFDRNREANLLKLQKDLRDGTYKTSPYRFFKVYDPKERDICSLPYYPDRICHHAVIRVIEPILIGSLIEQTYSCIKGRGIHAGVKAVKKALLDRENTRYCLVIDIRHFYPSIDHDLMKSKIRKKIKDERVLKIIDEWIDSYDSEEIEGIVGSGRKGLPIGNYPSQDFANYFLGDFDHWIKEEKKVKYYFRYADNLVVFSSSKPYLHSLLNEIRDYLYKNELLRIKGNWQVIDVDAEGVDFLGYRFYHDKILIRKRIKQNIAKKVVSCKRKGMSGEETHKAVGSYQGWLNYANTKNLIRKLNILGNGKIFK